MSAAWGWGSLALLGAYHGINPAMGWLFAVALGMQQRSGGAVLAALLPIALGHALSIGVTIGVLALGWAALPTPWLARGVAALLILFGLWKLVRPRHPRWVGMRVGFRDLTAWSFLMATAHGAGLMLLPVFLLGSAAIPHHEHAAHAVAAPWLASMPRWVAAVGVHTVAMLTTSAAIALVVYYKVGLAMLRRAWLDLDRVWAAAIIASGIVVLL